MPNALRVGSVGRLSRSPCTLLLVSKFGGVDYVRCFGMLARYVAQNLIFGLREEC
jgi:hypothetical protein